MFSTSPTLTVSLVSFPNTQYLIQTTVTNSQSATTTPTDVNSFIDICAAEGQQAKCCLIPILGQALLCSDVNPTAAAPAAAA
jgi:hypothetical protein